MKKYNFKLILWFCVACLFTQCEKDEDGAQGPKGDPGPAGADGKDAPYAASVLRSAIWEAVLSEDVEEVNTLIAALQALKGEAAVNSLIQGYRTPLTLAARNNDGRAVTDALLATSGIDVNVKLPESHREQPEYTALHFAAENDSVHALHALLEETNTDVNVQNGWGQTALHMALRYNKSVKKALRALLALPDTRLSAATVNAQENEGGWTALQLAAGFWVNNVAAELNMDNIADLINDSRIDPNIKLPADHEEYPGYAALHLAVWHRRTEVVQALVSFPSTRINVNLCSGADTTPLDLAHNLTAGADKTAIWNALSAAGAKRSWDPAVNCGG